MEKNLRVASLQISLRVELECHDVLEESQHIKIDKYFIVGMCNSYFEINF